MQEREKKSNVYEEFIGISSLSKTIRNELVPTAATRRHIEDNGVITEDELRAEKRQELKEIMDDYYRAYIESKLSNVRDIKWDELFVAMEKCQKDSSKDNKKLLEDEQSLIRKQIYGYLSDDKDFKKLFCAEIISDLLPKFINNNVDYSEQEKQDKLETVNLFNRFSTSFTDYFNNRKNIFSNDEISSSICFRVANENATIFLQNLCCFRNIKKYASQEIELIEEENKQEFSSWRLEQMYSPDFYGMLLTQGSIDYFNRVSGIVNSHMNLYCQQTKSNINLFRMRKLHKQILAKAESSFEIPLMYENDEEVYKTVNAFISNVNSKDIFARLKLLGKSVGEYDLSRIYISGKYYESLSICISGKWDVIKNCLTEFYKENIPGKGKTKDEKVRKAVNNDKYKSLEDIDDLISEYGQESNKDNKIIKSSKYITDIVDIVSEPISCLEYNSGVNLIEDEKKSTEIKGVLDKCLNIFHWLKTFMVEESLDCDVNFYSEVNNIYDELEDIVSLYNKVRNYVTQKPFSTEKIKLNFKSPTLANGWSQSKEFDNNAILLLRDGKYYLAIFNTKDKPDKTIIAGNVNCGSNTDYKKMVYNLLPGANKMLPKVFISSKKGVETYSPSNYLLEGYKEGKHIKSNSNFDIKFCRDLIDYFKACINIHPEWKNFGFIFSDTSSYNDISEFYREVEKQGYKISWTYISEEDINRLDEDGQIYLFQIYNKDFSEKSTGKANLHTMYLKNLFSEENLKDIVLKLNGEAELFFRKSSIKCPVIHEKGSCLVNKTITETDENGLEIRMPIPDDIYISIYNHYNNGTELSPEAEKLINTGKIETKNVQKEIIKDYRYTVDKFFIHLPITINFKADSRKNLNDMVLKYISEKEDIHVIGIDRGERNLLYVSVIDSHGNIIKQKSFNVVKGYNYKEKLKDREKTRDYARKNWKEIGKIKELKEGYLSSVIHEITDLMREYNAIIAMEDLNYGFKRGRFKVERQVYQKFETMLISKLNYLVSKDFPVDENGGLLRGYQLTYIPESLKDVGRQCGFIFYVPAAYTSKIDPETGFINAFNFNSITNKKEFLMKFDDIKYDDERQMFKFSFDYNNFDTHKVTLPKTKWDVYTNGVRLNRKFSNGRFTSESEEINLTERLADAFNNKKIAYNDGHNLKIDIESMDENEHLLSEIVSIFKYTVQMRNSLSEIEEEKLNDEYDRLISPVLNKDNVFFDSDTYKGKEEGPLPCNADANGAYCIALKGLYEVMRIKENWTEEKFDRDVLRIRNEDWFDFIQNKRYV